MRKIICIYLIAVAFVSFANSYDKTLQTLGFDLTREELRDRYEIKSKNIRDQKISTFSANIYDKNGILSNTGLTGSFDLENAFVLRPGELSVAYNYVYLDGVVPFQGTLKDAKQTEKNMLLSYGVTENIEAGFSFIDFFGEFSDSADQNVSLQTLNFKYSFPMSDAVVAIGGHYTDITPKDQININYSVIEKSNSLFFVLSDNLSPFLKTSVNIKSSFIRTIKDVAGFNMSGTSFTTTGISFDYSRIDGINYIFEVKKMNGDFVMDNNDLVVNAGLRIKNSKFGTNLIIKNITNSSDKIYGYSINYNF